MADVKTPAEKRKKKARSKINNALRDGKIKKPHTCAKCGRHTAKLQAHHKHGYSGTNNRSIEWLCPHCHKIETDKAHGKSRVSGQTGKGH